MAVSPVTLSLPLGTLDCPAREKYGRSVLEFSVHGPLDHPGVGVALRGTGRPDQLNTVEGYLAGMWMNPVLLS